jgi:hypothetical protein
LFKLSITSLIRVVFASENDEGDHSVALDAAVMRVVQY